MAEPNIGRTLFGTSDGSLDPKSGRINVPTDLGLQSKTVRIMADPDRARLEIRLEEAFQALVHRVEVVAATLPPDTAEALLTDYLGFSALGQVDASFRLVLPKKLREILGGETDLVFCANGECLQVWPATLWRQEQEKRRAALKRDRELYAHALLGVARAPEAPASATEPAA